MFRMRFAAALLACLLLPTLARTAEPTPERAPERTANIKRLLVATGVDTQMVDLLDAQVSQTLDKVEKDGFPVTPEVRGIVEREIRAVVDEKMREPGGIFDQLVPIYADMLTDEEVKQYAAFYESPLGRKIVAGEAKTAMRVGLIFLSGLGDVSITARPRVDAALRRAGIAPKAAPAPSAGQI